MRRALGLALVFLATACSHAQAEVPGRPIPQIVSLAPQHHEPPPSPSPSPIPSKLLSRVSQRPKPPHTVGASSRPGVEQWRALITANGRTAWSVEEVLRVMTCESGGRANATNAGNNGLMQVSGGPFDPEANLAWAYGMWKRQRWAPWTCKP